MDVVSPFYFDLSWDYHSVHVKTLDRKCVEDSFSYDSFLLGEGSGGEEGGGMGLGKGDGVILKHNQKSKQEKDSVLSVKQ